MRGHGLDRSHRQQRVEREREVRGVQHELNSHEKHDGVATEQHNQHAHHEEEESEDLRKMMTEQRGKSGPVPHA